MANRRMFSKKIVESDAFLDMPLSAQALYFHLGMEADDDGFIGSSKRIQRAIGAADDDMKLLIAKRFILRHESGIVIIKHWRVNNSIRADRHTKTIYDEVMDVLTLKENGVYTEKEKVRQIETECENSANGNRATTKRQPNDNKMTPERQPNGNRATTNRSHSIGEYRIGKVSIGEESIDTRAREEFVHPELDEVRAFVSEQGLIVDPDRFFYYYQGKGWMVGGSKMKDWQATILGWDRKERADGRNESGSSVRPKSGAYKNIGGVQV